MLRKKSAKYRYVKCPNCSIRGIDIPLDSKVGDGVFCEICDFEFEIISISPVKIKPMKKIKSLNKNYHTDDNIDMEDSQ